MMLKKILTLKNVTILGKQNQKTVNGGIICDPCNLLPGQTCYLQCPKDDHNH